VPFLFEKIEKYQNISVRFVNEKMKNIEVLLFFDGHESLQIP
jgi:hypothetical protein